MGRKRTISYVDPADEEKPKLQRARVYLEHRCDDRPAGGKLLVDQLVVHGTELAFCVPGESFLAVLDGLYDAPIRLISCRHESAAANMAEAYGKLTGRPGSASSRAAPARRTRPSASTPRSRTRPAPPPGGPGRLGPGGARGVPGDRLPADVRPDVEVGGADRPHRPDPRVRRARLRDRVLGPPGAGRARAARGHARPGERRRRRAAVPSGAAAPRRG